MFDGMVKQEWKARAKMADQEKSKFEVFRDDLRQMAEEIRLKVHLAGMDARDTWAKIEPKLHQFEQEAEKISADAGQEMRETRHGAQKVTN